MEEEKKDITSAQQVVADALSFFEAVYVETIRRMKKEKEILGYVNLQTYNFSNDCYTKLQQMAQFLLNWLEMGDKKSQKKISG